MATVYCSRSVPGWNLMMPPPLSAVAVKVPATSDLHQESFWTDAVLKQGHTEGPLPRPATWPGSWGLTLQITLYLTSANPLTDNRLPVIP
jgi:hypothetical protein